MPGDEAFARRGRPRQRDARVDPCRKITANLLNKNSYDKEKSRRRKNLPFSLPGFHPNHVIRGSDEDEFEK